jgi:hypothetical protein
MNKEHLSIEFFDKHKYRVYSSTTVANYSDRLIESMEKVKGTDYSSGKDFFIESMKVDPLFIELWDDLMHVIANSLPKAAHGCWVHSWGVLNKDYKDFEIEETKEPYSHNACLAGYINLNEAPGVSEVFGDGWSIPEKKGNIVIYLGSLDSEADAPEKFDSPRGIIRFKVAVGDGPEETAIDKEGYVSLPSPAEDWIPVSFLGALEHDQVY